MTSRNALTDLQVRRNEASADRWELAEQHRRRVTELVLNLCELSSPTLCVLGAGNCNDVDLKTLRQKFVGIDLVDIDAAALEQGVERQGCVHDSAIRRVGGCDITGIWPELADCAEKQPANDDQVAELVDRAVDWPGLGERGTYSVVVSLCVLSQLIDGVVRSVGESHPRFFELVAAVRLRHLRLLEELLAASGTGLLITDFVSSDTAPQLPNLTGNELSQTLLKMIEEQNFFSGLNPFRVQAVLAEDDQLRGSISSIRCAEPWLWNFGPRHYGVAAICFRKDGSSS